MAEEILNGIRTVLAFNAQEMEAERYNKVKKFLKTLKIAKIYSI